MVSEVQSGNGYTFTVQINGGPKQQFTTRTGIYRQVAAAAIAMLPYEAKEGPVIVEVDDQMGESYTYRIGSSQDGSLVVETHNPGKDKMVMDFALSQGVMDSVPSVLVEYRSASL